ncbi:MAG: hypothetical protein WB421_04990 [Terriglobales bacterium]
MYTGTLISDLMAAVERVENRMDQHMDATLVEQWQALPAYELPAADLLGVA